MVRGTELKHKKQSEIKDNSMMSVKDEKGKEKIFGGVMRVKINFISYLFILGLEIRI